MPAASKLSKLLSGVEKFVLKHQGEWGHDEWEKLVADSRALGYPFDDDECRRNLGNILEASKYFYQRGDGAPVQAPAKQAAPAKKAAPRKKAAQ
ncbi:MAG: hypothetical protein RBU21_20050 [FCB group bacterium]|jgi:hypothetical protein|nr:hypothetical protein [FCB group bacterium]